MTGTGKAEAPRGILRPPPLVAVSAFLKLGLLLSCAAAYGYSGSELYDLACARHLTWGFVDRPPLSVAVLSLVTRLYGETLLSVRLAPAFAGAFVILLAARLSKRFGATTRGQALVGLLVLTTPGLLADDHIFSARALSGLFTVVAFGIVARALTAEPDHPTLPWVRVGLIFGLGAQNDLTMVPLGAALVVGLALFEKGWMRRGAPWLALGVSVVTLAPFLAWQRARGWPLLAFASRAVHAPDPHAILGFLGDAFQALGPVQIVIVTVGLVGFLRHPRLVPYRSFGVAIGCYLALAVLVGHASDALCVFPLLIAAAVVRIDDWTNAARWRTPALAVTALAVAAAMAPLSLPLLRVRQLDAYRRALHLAPRDGVTVLPERFADMYGWPELVRAVASVAESLPPLDREDAVVLASNAGEGGALMFLGGAVGLPPVISGNNQFWPWGTGGSSGRVVIAVGGDEAFLRSKFQSVEVATVFGHSLATTRESHVKIYVCRDSRAPLDGMWPDFKRYD
jgi:hypothetical protein